MTTVDSSAKDRAEGSAQPGAEGATPAENARPRATEMVPTDIYAVHGAEPEVIAYAMAKYSRSALSMRESLREIDEQKAEKFLNTFYFQYGHRSIADLAHVNLALEKLSVLAAIEVADESPWDGQERSTRYQAFRQGEWRTPPELPGEAQATYDAAMGRAFSAYAALSERVLEHYRRTVPRPEAMKPEAYERTLRARAFDAGRYLLPLGTATSLGQIVSARVLERQIARLLSSPHGEVRAVGAGLRAAASGAAYDPRGAALERVAAYLRERGEGPEGAEARAAAEGLARPVRVAPTLVKYADPNRYEIETRRELAQAAAELLRGQAIESGETVDLVEAEALETEVAATLLYGASHHSYRQIAAAVGALPAARRDEIVELGLRHRGRHDELARAFRAGHGLRFDLLMDVGGFRDLHRHRRCVQTLQDYTFAHGFATPAVAEECGAGGEYREAMAAARRGAEEMAARCPTAAAYLLPLGYRRRSLFAMDFAEFAYIAEQRTAPAGHPSYREAAWAMYEAARRRHPALTRHLRVTDPAAPVDLLQR